MTFPRTDEPDYQLMMPRLVFVEEVAKLLNNRKAGDWDDRAALLLDDAFVRGYEGGPVSEFHSIPAEGPLGEPWGTPPSTSTAGLTARQRFLKDLMSNADGLREDASHRRPYWRERQAGQRGVAVLDAVAVAREFVTLAHDLDEAGYFEKRLGKDCVDDPRGDTAEVLIERELGLKGVWPLDASALAGDLDILFDVIELLHDISARPTDRYYHSYSQCGWHHQDFAIAPGRAIYRWRVNKILERSDLGLRLANEGEDVGRLVTVTDDARADLVHAVVNRDDEPADQVRHALALFRRRGADRNDKRSAVTTLALVLEERRKTVLEDVLASSDRGALFEIANKFHIRHQDAQQRRDYDDFYLDWIFWLYLSTIELTNRVIDQQGGTNDS